VDRQSEAFPSLDGSDSATQMTSDLLPAVQKHQHLQEGQSLNDGGIFDQNEVLCNVNITIGSMARFMQAVGRVNDHLVSCFRSRELRNLR
jgi:hypothetical protein